MHVTAVAGPDIIFYYVYRHNIKLTDEKLKRYKKDEQNLVFVVKNDGILFLTINKQFKSGSYESTIN